MRSPVLSSLFVLDWQVSLSLDVGTAGAVSKVLSIGMIGVIRSAGIGVGVGMVARGAIVQIKIGSAAGL